MTDPDSTGAPFRVIHTADWHLGKTLGDLSREDEHARFLEFLLATIAQENADLLIIAGDIFDSANPPQSAEKQYFDFLVALRRTTTCRVLITAGNHDSPSGLDAPKRLLGALEISVIGEAPADPADAIFYYPDSENPVLAVAAVPFLRDRDLRTSAADESAADIQRALVAGIAARYQDVGDAIPPGVAALATGHLTVAGSSTSESEREIHIGGLGAVTAATFPARFSYVALGHLHRPQACGDAKHVRYSGSPIPLSFSESKDKKSLRLLEFAGGKLTESRAIPIPLARPLVQIKTSREQIASSLAAFTPPESPLPAWVELIIEGTLLGEDAFAIAREAAADQPFEVIRVLTTREAPVALASGKTAHSQEDDLLQRPAEVFARRLDAEPDLPAADRESLETAFLTLLEQHQDSA